MLNHTQNENKKQKKLVDSFKYLMFPPRRIEMLPFLQKKKKKEKSTAVRHQQWKLNRCSKKPTVFIKPLVEKSVRQLLVTEKNLNIL